ncbi:MULTISPECIES: metallophosphoesterase [Flavobacterium]|jgi:predicted MPP superfamily phosphohydrolase|uniref:Metallophosphoesterase n=1 Tax=Flavobacterium macrobrachii TaxID=591204 RepID=A0ABS2CXQ1_9FLAO|nr:MULTISPECIES: metallophosphoesterase [Flavobacterium]MBM6499696.1 metallophosphoesterase [Flavobacterium macrobrachii]MCZ8089444.1 metallophosphoesterase [Flavobacterium sp.]PZO31238.1 MAG: phosphoesterase [Flavobacteriaceae bacterium]
MFRWLFLFIIIAIVEIYSFQAIRTISKSRVVLSVYLIVSISVIIFIFYQFSKFDRSVGQTQMSLFTLGLLLLVLVPKIIMTLFMFLEDIFRIFSGTITHFMGDNDSGNFLPNRRKFISQMALAIAAIPFTSLLYGMTKGKYNYKVIKQTLFFSDLPDDFDGFTITQISDVHSGSFDNPEKIQYAVDLINQHKTDLMLFTGDIVNTHATEMHPWIETFNKIDNHQYGKFAVLGNHDYGEYVTWSSQAAKDENFEAIKKVYGDIGFDLLLNQNKKIKKGSSEIAIVGVENWGKNFKQAGDLNKASEGLSNEDFKILMSHDPSHWEYEVKNHDKNFQLTLSGHTHGLQFGIEIPGIIRWSPVQYVYKQWAGLYENLGRYIYVNRGFGFHAYPGRVGIWPEITVFELKKAEKVA